MLIPQQVYVFQGTVRESFGHLASTATDTELRRAAGEVGAGLLDGIREPGGPPECGAHLVSSRTGPAGAPPVVRCG